MKRYARLPLRQYKTVAILATVLVCMAVLTLMACQLHAIVSAHEHIVPGGHHRSPLASSACVSAVLPAATLFIVFSSLWFSAAVVSWPANAPVMLPFTPPQIRSPLAPCSPRDATGCVTDRDGTGQLFLFYAAFYSLGRFVIEGFRADQLTYALGDVTFSTARTISLVVFGGAIFLHYYFQKTRRQAGYA